MEPQPGSRVEVRTKDQTYEGILIPSTEEDTLIIKQASGYNIGILKSAISEIKVTAGVAKKESKPETLPSQVKGLKKITILHTGGTIASKVDYITGGVTSNFSAQEMLQMFPELQSLASIKSRQIMRAQSEMMRFAHYNLMADAIAEEVAEGAEGIILTHGTDTLHYTSAALAFMLQNLPVPVILVGAQRSSDRGSTDAALNLISAVYFAANSKFMGVGICMHSTPSDTECLILPATRSRKMHTSRRDAFRPINSKPIATVNYENRNITYHQELETPKGQPETSHINPNLKIGIIKTHPNMYAQQFLSYKGYDGLILEGTGLGHIPNQQTDDSTTEHVKIQETVAELIKTGTTVAMAAQTIYGRVQLNVYTPQRMLANIGVLGHLCDMTPETAFIKLAWLLSNHKDKTAELYEKNIIGEISERTTMDGFLE